MKEENSVEVGANELPSASASSGSESTDSAGRRMYSAPKLRHLGSVRELTFASKGVPLPDGVTTQAPM